ncbi:MAG: hypothetical protein HYT65_02940 [Candidatus Yanofskybacteria bacterium]|nr:hypothetical protein [Candidatus Yanofskybacteria bacterium]
MLLSQNQILKHLRGGTIVIEPFNKKQLKTTSYDVTLGEWFWREGHPAGRATIHNLYDARSTNSVWQGPFRADLAGVARKRLNSEFKNIPDKARVILIAPGETILAHTAEFIGGREICVAKMYARSSLGRNFVEVCKDAGWGDVGYFNRWTMEVTNNSKYYTIPLVVGWRIAQMVFYEVAPLTVKKIDYVGEGGKYQLSQNIKELKKTWKPEMMLPKMHLDWEVNKR